MFGIGRDPRVGPDLSGLYEEGSVLWGAQNSGKLWRMVSDGSGSPDGEAVALTATGAAGGAYVATERNGDASGTSRLSVLRDDVNAGTGSSLTATKEWNLTAGLPAVGSNLGFEAITWIPDATLTAAGFKDESTGTAYDPDGHGAHAGGVSSSGSRAPARSTATCSRTASPPPGSPWSPAACRV